MKLALLGLDNQMIALALAAQREGLHRVVGIYGDSAQVQLARQNFPEIVALEDWQSVLDLKAVDAVLVSAGDSEDGLAEQLRKLVQVGVPIVASHPLGLSMLVYFELEMIRHDVQGTIIPFLPWRKSTAIGKLSTLLKQDANSPIGAVQQITVERSLPNRSLPTPLDYFAQDVDFIRSFCGEIKHVSAMGNLAGVEAKVPAGLNSLGVQMAGVARPLIRWSTEPGVGDSECRVSLHGSSGKAVLTIPSEDRPWTYSIDSIGTVEAESFAADRIPELILADLDQNRRTILQWTDACKAVEITEAAVRSLRKGRTVEIHDEEFSESGTFKGMMTSVGCGLLIFGLMMLGFVAVAQQLAEAANFTWLAMVLGKWPYLLLVVLVGFLFLQGLLKVARRSPTGDD